MTTRSCALLLTLLLAGSLALPAVAGPPTLAVKIAAIEAAQTAELARLDGAIASTSEPAAILALQRCAAHVKLASRLALHQAQLAATTDEALAATLTGLVERLGDRLAATQAELPEDYAFDPLAALRPEVTPCAD